jgi:site-specific recombinase XerD
MKNGSRFSRNNKNLRTLAEKLEITDMKLTSYVSRYTMAMTLQDNQIPREVISQILGHSDLATTITTQRSSSLILVPKSSSFRMG